MATANANVKKALNRLNQKISSVGGVIDSWSDGNGNWWRKYSDGWLEQGGRLSSNGSPISLVFNAPFSTTVYSVGGFAERESNFNNDYAVMTYSRTAAGITIEADNETQYINWFACGY